MNFILEFDLRILDFIQQHLRNEFLDTIFPIITTLGNGGMIWIVIALLFLISRKYRKYGVMLSISLLMCLLIGNITLKPLIARIRPFDINTAITLIISKPTDYSFPSGHTLSSFAAAIIIFYTDKRMGIPALFLASFIAFSRLYLYVHYPSDILFGIILAFVISVTVIKLYKIRENSSIKAKE